MELPEKIELPQEYLLHDPQTSGGLLMALPKNEASKVLTRLKASGHAAAIVGEVGGPAERPLRVLP